MGASEEDALMQLKQGFGNPIELSSWNSTINGSPCSGGWTGIACENTNQSVVRLSLRGVNFTDGNLSSSIGDLPNLQYIDLSHNGLIGHIPAEINKLPSLLHLDLSNNAFTGGLPEVWSNLTLLVNLTLTANQLNGSIPIGLIDAKSLMRLRLEHNQLSGTIPPGIFDQTSPRLRNFAVEYNNISGPIPAEIGQCFSLRSFYAASNHLNGLIPESIGSLSNLVHFEVDGNELSGPLPESMDNLNGTLVSLNVSNNRLTGQIPVGLSATFNDSSFLGNPSLCGSPLSNTCPVQEGTPPSPPSFNHWEPSMNNRKQYNRKSSSSQKGKIIAGIIGGVAAALVLLLLFILVSRQLKKGKSRDSSQVQNWFSPDIQANRRKGRYEIFHRGFQYTYEEIVSSAGYFDTAHVIGKGRFATVYRSLLPDGNHMAVKVFRFANVPPIFEKEIEMLASIEHRNVLSIKGFYTNPVEKAVLFDYLPTGSLYDLLHGQANTVSAPAQGVLPDWSARHTIALGVAQAMAYLHRGCGYRILHRDLKSTNILLEADLMPRVSDHGLVHMVSGKPGDVVETEGYTAPEVLTSKKYTEKSDVYSYGVILMELITGKKAVSYVRERSVSLTNWVIRLHKERRVREVIDAVTVKTCPLPEYLDKTVDLAVFCVDPDPNNRPSMAEIVSVLEGFRSSFSPLRSPEVRLDMPLLPSHK